MRKRYTKRCGFVKESGERCQTPIPSELHRCRHHAKSDVAYVRAKRIETFRLEAQRDATKDARSRFADTAFEYGLDDQRTVDALERWHAAKAAEGGPDLPAWVLPDELRKA